MKAKKRVTKLVFMVVIVFIGEAWLIFGSVQSLSCISVCWAPIHIVFLKKSFSVDSWVENYGKLSLQV